jgi:hypothetical protein
MSETYFCTIFAQADGEVEDRYAWKERGLFVSRNASQQTSS